MAMAMVMAMKIVTGVKKVDIYHVFYGIIHILWQLNGSSAFTQGRSLTLGSGFGIGYGFLLFDNARHALYNNGVYCLTKFIPDRSKTLKKVT